MEDIAIVGNGSFHFMTFMHASNKLEYGSSCGVPRREKVGGIIVCDIPNLFQLIT
jgi:hypothetical protein